MQFHHCIRDMSAGRNTARLMFARKISTTNLVVEFSREEFAALNVSNHRAELGAGLSDIFPLDDCPRGDADILSVEYFM